MYRTLAALAIIATLTALCIILFRNDNLYRYDEADYAFAVEQGLVANYVDENAMSLRSFLETGTSMGGDRSKRAALSELARTSGDLTFYRHYHAPLYVYWLSIGRAFGLVDERAMRATSMVLLGLLAALLFVVAYRWHDVPFAIALLPVALVFGCRMSILTVAQLTPHALYACTSVLALALLSRYLRSGKLADWYASIIALGLAFLSVEYAALVAASFAICLFIHRRERIPKAKAAAFIARALGLLVLTIGVLWAGGIVKLSLVKNYITFAYISIVRGAEFGSGGFFGVWGHHFSTSPVVCTIALSSLVFAIVRIRRDRTLLPYLVYPLLVVATSLRNASVSPTYVSSIFPPLFLLAAITAAAMLANRHRAYGWALTITTAVLAAVVLNPPRNGIQPDRGDVLVESVVQTIGSLPRSDSVLLVPRMHLPMVHYYHRDRILAGYAEDVDDTATIGQLLSRRRFNGAVYLGATTERFAPLVLRRYGFTIDTVVTPLDDRFFYFHLRQL